MIRLLILFLVAVLLARFILKNLTAGSSSEKIAKKQKVQPDQQAIAEQSEKLSPCSVCGVYFRESQGISRGYKLYCSETCIEEIRN